MRKAPSKEEFPSCKIRPFINWFNYQRLQAWQMGCSVAVDEMTMRFKGHYCDKLRITYKAEGDGFQANALCDYCYFNQVYMRNDPAPRKYLKQGLSPLHSRKMALFDSLKEDHNQVGMNNLDNYAAFCRYANHHACKVL